MLFLFIVLLQSGCPDGADWWERERERERWFEDPSLKGDMGCKVRAGKRKRAVVWRPLPQKGEMGWKERAGKRKRAVVWRPLPKGWHGLKRESGKEKESGIGELNLSESQIKQINGFRWLFWGCVVNLAFLSLHFLNYRSRKEMLQQCYAETYSNLTMMYGWLIGCEVAIVFIFFRGIIRIWNERVYL